MLFELGTGLVQGSCDQLELLKLVGGGVGLGGGLGLDGWVLLDGSDGNSWFFLAIHDKGWMRLLLN